MQIEQMTIPACDGFSLAATCYRPEQNPTNTVVLINAATAVPQRYYKYFAKFMMEQGYTAVTYDYRGIAASKPASLRGFAADARDWALQDMAGVIAWIQQTIRPRRLFMIGHSFGGQTAGLLPNHDRISAMVTMSSQSGYWRLQGGNQKLPVLLHVYLTLPILSRLFGYMPWSKISPAEDLPKGVALEWSRWCRKPGYLLDDETLPLARYQQFRAPVLAYSIADDDWGTARSVDAMMRAYPDLTRRHMTSLGHFGYFRPKAKVLWPDVVEWLEQAAPPPKTDTDKFNLQD